MAAIHVVYVRLVDSSLRDDVVTELRSRLVALGAGIEVGVPADAHAEAAWDLCVHARFVSAQECAEAVGPGGPLALVLEPLFARAKVWKGWSFRC